MRNVLPHLTHQQLSLLPQEDPDRCLSSRNGPGAEQDMRQMLQGPELELAMRRVWRQWARWHRCATFEQAVQDGVTRRLLELTARRGRVDVRS